MRRGQKLPWYQCALCAKSIRQLKRIVGYVSPHTPGYEQTIFVCRKCWQDWFDKKFPAKPVPEIKA